MQSNTFVDEYMHKKSSDNNYVYVLNDGVSILEPKETTNVEFKYAPPNHWTMYVEGQKVSFIRFKNKYGRILTVSGSGRLR